MELVVEGFERGYRHGMMRFAAIALTALALVGCTEIYDGPRVVYYSDTNFYIRHFPWTYGDAEVAALADQVCQRIGGEAALESDQQYYSFDLRYATYNCIGANPEPPLHDPDPVPPPDA